MGVTRKNDEKRGKRLDVLQNWERSGRGDGFGKSSTSGDQGGVGRLHTNKIYGGSCASLQKLVKGRGYVLY